MNKEQKAAVIDDVATQIQEAEAIFAVDYRGISVQQVADLRRRLSEADATLRVVKNTLTERAADKAGAETLKSLLEGPTAFTFVRGDAALAAKAIATFRREHEVPSFKGGTMDGAEVTVDEIEAIAKLPARDVLHGQMVGVLAAPVTGLVRGLNALVGGLALQLGQIKEQGLVGGDVDSSPQSPDPSPQGEGSSGDEAPSEEGASGEERASEEDAGAEEAASEEGAGGEEAPAAGAGEEEQTEASGEEPAENDDTEAPSEGGDEAKEG